MKTQITFHIDAGKYEPDGELNYKYGDQAETIEDAIRMYESARGYDFVEFYMLFEVDGASSTIWIEGGPMLEQQMRMSFAHLWAVATRKQFVDITMDWEKQAEDIEKRLMRDREIKDGQQLAIRHLQDKIKKLQADLTNANYELVQYELQHKRLQWPDVQQQFVNGLLSWTEAFEALMSQCGMSMEEALQCFAENFDCRPAVNVKEV